MLRQSPYGRHHRLLQCLCPLSSTGGHVCMRACPGRGMYVCGKRISQFFALLDSLLWPHRLRPCCPRQDRMDLMSGYLLRMICHRIDLPLPVFRGSKGPIRTKLSLQQLRRPQRIHTPLVLANAVIMWCMECIWTSYHNTSASLIDRLYVWEARCFTSSSLLHLHKSLFVPFSVIRGSGYFSLILWLFMCLLCVCLCLCGVALLSLSLWIVAGMVVVWRYSRAEGEDHF